MVTPLYRSRDEALASIPTLVRGLAPEDPHDVSVLVYHRDSPFELTAASWDARAYRGGPRVPWLGVFVWRHYPRGVASVGVAASPEDGLLVETSRHCRFLIHDDKDERWWWMLAKSDGEVGSIVATFADADEAAASTRDRYFLLGGRLRGLRVVRIMSPEGELLEAIAARGAARDHCPPSDATSAGAVDLTARSEITIEAADDASTPDDAGTET